MASCSKASNSSLHKSQDNDNDFRLPRSHVGSNICLELIARHLGHKKALEFVRPGLTRFQSIRLSTLAAKLLSGIVSHTSTSWSLDS